MPHIFTKREIRITHLHATRYNVGDDAIVMATYHLTKELMPEHRLYFYDVSRDRFARPGEPVIDFIPLYQYHRPKYLFKLFNFLLRSNAVMIGGGELICGALEFLSIALIAKLMGKPVVFYSVGVNLKGNSFINDYYTKIILSMVDKIVVREKDSYNELKKLKIDMNKVKSAVDIVFALKPDINESRASKIDDRNKQIKIGVSLRSQESPEREFNMEKVIFLAKIFDKFVSEYNSKIIFYPFLDERSPFEKQFNDKIFSTDKSILEYCQSLMVNYHQTEIYSKDLNPLSIMNHFKGLDVLLSMRLHAAILAINVGVIPIALSYAPKIEKIFSMLRLSENIIDINKISDDKIEKLISHLLREKPHIKTGQSQRCLMDLARQNIIEIKDIISKPRRLLSYFLLPLGILGLFFHLFVLLCSKLPSPRRLSSIAYLKKKVTERKDKTTMNGDTGSTINK